MAKRVSAEILDRLPPQSVEAERSVVGAIMLSPGIMSDLATLIGPNDFYSDRNGRLYRHLLGLHDSGVRIDTLTVLDRLRTSGDLEEVGGVAYLAEVVQSVPTAAHFAYYAKIVAEKSRRRRMIHAASEMLRRAYDEAEPVDEILGACEAELQRIPTGEFAGEPIPFAESLMQACEYVDDVVTRKRSAGVMTGIEKFDLEAGGLFPSELIVLAARPSIGKTAMALQFAKFAAFGGKAVYFCSLEMPHSDLALRTMCGDAGVPLSRVRSADVDSDALAAIGAAAAGMFTLPIVMHDRPGITAQEIRRACQRLKSKGKLDLVVVDYLQRVTPANRRDDRHLQIGQITADMKAMARELRVPVLLLCQLGRSAETVEPKTGKIVRPRKSMLKESGDIEQDADMILLIHRQERCAETELILAKNRQGSQASFNLVFDAERMLFSSTATWGSGGFA